MDNRGIDTDPGWINRKIHAIERAIEGLRSERRAAATTVSEGDFIVSGGGSVLVKDGGDVAVSAGGSVDVTGTGGINVTSGSVNVSGGSVNVSGGGKVLIRDGGGLQALHASGTTAAYFGPYDVGGVLHQGLLILGPDGKPVMSGEYDTVSGARRVKLGNVGAGLEEVLAIGFGESRFWIQSNGDVQINPDVAGGKTVAIGHQTTANAANVHMDTSGRVYRSTSSRRYKQDERPADIDTSAVLALQPRVFRTVDEVDEEGEAAPTHVGFIAEEAADLGLEHWVGRDDDGEPESFAYSQFCVAQQAVIQAQQAQINDLAEKVSALTAKQQTTTRSI